MMDNYFIAQVSKTPWEINKSLQKSRTKDDELDFKMCTKTTEC